MRRICVFTSTRAEYGLLKPLMEKIYNAPDLKLQTIASGTHLCADHGMTINQIKADGFDVDSAVNMISGQDTPEGICRDMGEALARYAEAITRLDPDIIVILGDRFEAFCMASAAVVCRIPIAHIHGGEVTCGAMDDAFRHSITKMSHLHFTCCQEYRQRVIQLGENPERVFETGALGVEGLRNMTLMTEGELKKAINILSNDAFFLVTYHPETLSDRPSEQQFDELEAALLKQAFHSYKIVFTYANADTGSSRINRELETLSRTLPERVRVCPNLGQLKYLSAMKYAAAVIGNSSSGILEAPAFKTPVVNVGNRQKGRVCAGNIINSECSENQIVQAIERAVSEPFKASIQGVENPFEKKGTAALILEQLKNSDVKGMIQKEFYDVK